jgi:lysine 2,3-aminomutase
MVAEYDREHGISYWTKNYRTSIESTVDADEVESRRYAYYDPIDTLPEAGQRWWRKQVETTDAALAATVAS